MSFVHVHRVKSARVLRLRYEPNALANCKSRATLTIDSCKKLRFRVRLRARHRVSPSRIVHDASVKKRCSDLRRVLTY